jgi:hypothetical protein
MLPNASDSPITFVAGRGGGGRRFFRRGLMTFSTHFPFGKVLVKTVRISWFDLSSLCCTVFFFIYLFAGADVPLPQTTRQRCPPGDGWRRAVWSPSCCVLGRRIWPSPPAPLCPSKIKTKITWQLADRFHSDKFNDCSTTTVMTVALQLSMIVALQLSWLSGVNR